MKSAPGSAALFFCLAAAACVDTEVIDEVVPARVDLTPSSAAVQSGFTLSLQAIYFDSRGIAVPGAAIEWASTDAEVAAVDASGLVLGIRPGQALITAAHEGVTSTPSRLTVVADPNQIAGIVITPPGARIAAGGTVPFTALARNLNGDELPSLAFTWSSSAPAVASIDGSGTATGVAPGRAEIIASAAGVDSPPAVVEVLGRVRAGSFVSNPRTGYHVSGSVTLEEQPDGALLLKLADDFVSSAGPGLDLFLSSGSFVSSTQSRSLGRLQATTGSQSYTVPAGISIDTYDWVVIHCVPFNVTFGYAQLSP